MNTDLSAELVNARNNVDTMLAVNAEQELELERLRSALDLAQAELADFEREALAQLSAAVSAEFDLRSQVAELERALGAQGHTPHSPSMTNEPTPTTLPDALALLRDSRAQSRSLLDTVAELEHELRVMTTTRERDVAAATLELRRENEVLRNRLAALGASDVVSVDTASDV